MIKKSLIMILALIGIILISGCVQEPIIKPPTVEVVDAKILELSVNKATVDITLVVHNPNPIGATFNKIDYDVYFKDERPLRGSGEYEFMGHSTDEKKVTVESGDTTFHTFLTVENRRVLQALVTLVVQEKVWIKIKGTASLDLKATSYDIPFGKEILVPLPK
ncbi:MAG: LEA type 2 family protein [Candidatus Heimdallarchaeota archaeon]